jgi:predicted branched-subunit amino acid permease
VSIPPDPAPVVSLGEMAKKQPAVMIMLVVLLVFAGGAELFITWLLVEHVPWLGWPLTALSVAAVVYAIHRRWKRRGGGAS